MKISPMDRARVGNVGNKKKKALVIFADVIRDARKQKGLTQAEVARVMGVSRVQIAFYENGSNVPSFRRVLQLSRLLEVSLDRNDFVFKTITVASRRRKRKEIQWTKR